MSEVEQQYTNVKHFFLVTGDKDYLIKVEKLLRNGKHVHVISRASALGNPDMPHSYGSLARQYPSQFTISKLEDLLEDAS
jgi:uncharacterized LabA/DUF88 family protein